MLFLLLISLVSAGPCGNEGGFCGTPGCPAGSVPILGLGPSSCGNNPCCIWSSNTGCATQINGFCTSIAKCAEIGGTNPQSGLCPGSNNIKCCVPPTTCSIAGNAGVCQTSSSSCGGIVDQHNVFAMMTPCGGPDGIDARRCCVEDLPCTTPTGKTGKCMDFNAVGSACTDQVAEKSTDCPDNGAVFCCADSPKCKQRYVGDKGVRVILQDKIQRDAFRALQQVFEEHGIQILSDEVTFALAEFRPKIILLPRTKISFQALQPDVPLRGQDPSSQDPSSFLQDETTTYEELAPIALDMIIPSAVVDFAETALQNAQLGFQYIVQNFQEIIDGELNRIQGRMDCLTSCPTLSTLFEKKQCATSCMLPPGVIVEFVEEDTKINEDNNHNPNAGTVELEDKETIEDNMVQGPFDYCHVDIIGNNFFTEYWPFDCIKVWLQTLATKNSAIARLRTVGTSTLGKPILALEINKGGFSNAGKKANRAVIIGGNHAREWLAIHTVLNLAQNIIRNINQPWAQASSVEWAFIPVINPDGYEYTWPIENEDDCDRLWRKTRSTHPGMGSCIGVNINRNFNAGFCSGPGAEGKFSDACDDNYCGPNFESEPETIAVKNFVLDSTRGKTIMFIDMHTFSQEVILPPSEAASQQAKNNGMNPNDPTIRTLASQMTTAMSNKNSVKYRVLDSIKEGAPSGTTADFFFVNKIKHTFSFELRPGELAADAPSSALGDGFMIHPDNINPTAAEVLEGVKLAIASAVKG